MARAVSQQIKNLKGGISQQPENLRYPNQGDQQVNCWSSEAEGLQKRPPTVFVKHLDTYRPAMANAYYHMINRDETERYITQFCGQRIRVFDLDGNEKVVNGSEMHPYVQAANPREAIRVVSVADYTFVVNNTKVVTEDTVKTHADYGSLRRRALINVRGGQYGRTLKILVDKVLIAEVVIPDGSLPEHVKDTDSEVLVTKLVEAVNANTETSGVTATGGIGHILLTRNADIREVATSDGYANTLINGFVYQTNNMNKLPVAAPDGYLVEIKGEVTGTGDSYWVRYETDKGLWQETVAPNINRGVNKATMPHALIREANGTFTFRALDWSPRQSGDDETNPMPSFVGGTFNDVFYFRNRLGFLSGENVILSRAGKYFDHFPASVAVLNDDDPIDIAVSHNRISILRYAVPFSEELLLWSQEAQYVLSSSGILTSRSVSLELTTEFYVGKISRPFGIDRGVFFASPRASYASIKRYYMLQNVSNVKSAEDISAHVPNYVPREVFHMHGSGSENFLLCLSDSPKSRSVIYIYKYLYLDEELVQQAWSHWDFGEGTIVLTAFCIGSYMWVILNRNGNVSLERVEFTKDSTDFPVETYRTHMDMKKLTPNSGAFNEDTGDSTFSFLDIYGFVPPKGTYAINWFVGTFVLIEHDGVSPTFTVPTIVFGNPIIGKIYDMRYKFSKFLPKTQADDGTVMTEDLGRLQLARAWVNFDKTGSFEIQVDNGADLFRYPMGGGRYGNKSITINEFTPSTETMRYPVTGRAERQNIWIVSENPTPVSIVGCGWEGRLIKRSQSI